MTPTSSQHGCVGIDFNLFVLSLVVSDCLCDTSRHEQVVVVLKDVSGSVLRTEVGRHDRRANQRKVYLPPMRVRGQE